MRHHFAADLAEARKPIGDGEEAIFLHHGDVAGGVPAVVQYFGGLLRLAEIALHHVWPLHQQHARSAGGDRLAGIQIDDANGDARQWMADFAAPRSDLAESRSTEVAAIDRDHGRAFCAAVSFKGTNAKGVFEGQRDAICKFFRAH